MKYSYEEILEAMIKENGGEEIPNEFYCEKCGCVLCSLEDSYKLEEFFYEQGAKGPIYIDVCECEEDV